MLFITGPVSHHKKVCSLNHSPTALLYLLLQSFMQQRETRATHDKFRPQNRNPGLGWYFRYYSFNRDAERKVIHREQWNSELAVNPPCWLSFLFLYELSCPSFQQHNPIQIKTTKTEWYTTRNKLERVGWFHLLQILNWNCKIVQARGKPCREDFERIQNVLGLIWRGSPAPAEFWKSEVNLMFSLLQIHAIAGECNPMC